MPRLSRTFYFVSILISMLMGNLMMVAAMPKGIDRMRVDMIPVYLLGLAAIIYGVVVLFVLRAPNKMTHGVHTD